MFDCFSFRSDFHSFELIHSANSVLLLEFYNGQIPQRCVTATHFLVLKFYKAISGLASNNLTVVIWIWGSESPFFRPQCCQAAVFRSPTRRKNGSLKVSSVLNLTISLWFVYLFHSINCNHGQRHSRRCKHSPEAHRRLSVLNVG